MKLLYYSDLDTVSQIRIQFFVPAFKNRVDDRIIKINANSMEFFLTNLIVAFRDEMISSPQPASKQGFTTDEMIDIIDVIPEAILPEYRKKRQYVNAILSKNELDRDDKYNRKLFKRISRGCYDLLDTANLMLRVKSGGHEFTTNTNEQRKGLELNLTYGCEGHRGRFK
jgi:hypothetical protein